MNRLNAFLTLSVLIKCVFGETTSSLTVTLPQGKVKGIYDVKKSQIMFLGIPYASVQERYQAPGKPPSWKNTLSATQGSIKCKQYSALWKTVTGQEDCLVLNVFTPTYRDKNPLPVMVFIHGGGLYEGSNAEWLYNPRYLVKRKVIVVTINYRLGALGFLCLPKGEAPGNAGLKDQIAALKWIQNNIARFGGDPNSVTLFGQSLGGTSVNYLIYSRSAQGLFHRAIIESSTFLSPYFRYSPIESASIVAQRLGYSTSDPDELLKIYKNTSTDDIVKASARDTTNNAFAPYIFGPCVETAITNEIPVITEHPTESLIKNDLNIPVIIGFNNKEGIQWATSYVPISKEKIEENFDDFPVDLVFKNEADKKSFKEDIMSIYFSNGSVTENLIDYFTDSIIRYPLTTVSEHWSQNSTKSIYNYYFTYDSIRNLNKLITKLSTVPGADHADELFYLFDPIIFDLLPLTPKNQAMITKMTMLWTSFAKTEEPSDSRWTPSQEHLNFFELGEEKKIITIPNEDRIKFWKEQYKKYGRKSPSFY